LRGNGIVTEVDSRDGDGEVLVEEKEVYGKLFSLNTTCLEMMNLELTGLKQIKPLYPSA
jgi:hypothetical protein